MYTNEPIQTFNSSFSWVFQSVWGTQVLISLISGIQSSQEVVLNRDYMRYWGWTASEVRWSKVIPIDVRIPCFLCSPTQWPYVLMYDEMKIATTRRRFRRSQGPQPNRPRCYFYSASGDWCRKDLTLLSLYTCVFIYIYMLWFRRYSHRLYVNLRKNV